jgi:hypothetical protein
MGEDPAALLDEARAVRAMLSSQHCLEAVRVMLLDPFGPPHTPPPPAQEDPSDATFELPMGSVVGKWVVLRLLQSLPLAVTYATAPLTRTDNGKFRVMDRPRLLLYAFTKS